MRDLALELAPYGIRANGIAPGAIAAPIDQAMLDDPVAKRATDPPVISS